MNNKGIYTVESLYKETVSGNHSRQENLMFPVDCVNHEQRYDL
jgi:hypothetical protein